MTDEVTLCGGLVDAGWRRRRGCDGLDDFGRCGVYPGLWVGNGGVDDYLPEGRLLGLLVVEVNPILLNSAWLDCYLSWRECPGMS